jgi:hypothetical protein
VVGINAGEKENKNISEEYLNISATNKEVIVENGVITVTKNCPVGKYMIWCEYKNRNNELLTDNVIIVIQ